MQVMMKVQVCLEVGTIADYKPVTLKEHWNPYMMDIRKKLMAGEEIPQCNVCNDSVLSPKYI